MIINFKTLITFAICASISVILINCIHLKVTVVHEMPERVRIDVDADINHKTPYALRIVNGY